MTPADDQAPPAPSIASPAARSQPAVPWLLYAMGTVAFVALLSGVFLWQKVGAMQEHLARQSGDAVSQATDAKGSARQAQDVAIQTAAKLALTDARLSELALQRAQVEELIQSLSRSRDENLVADIDSAIRLAQQQAQLTGSAEPLLSALKTAETRLARAGQPRLAPVQRAIAHDIARIQATPLSDMPTLLLQLDELTVLADDLPLANAVGQMRPADALTRKPQEPMSAWWLRIGSELQAQVKDLVRVSKIAEPEAALLSPEQSFFLRENFKLRVLNARLGLMSRQIEPARADLASALGMLTRYFAPASRKTQTAVSVLQQLQARMRLLEVPRVEETLAALATAAAGR